MGPAASKVLVDAHVHLHGQADEALAHAAANLDAARAELGLSPSVPAALMLTEVAGVDRFGGLKSGELDIPKGWTAVPGSEAESLRLQPREGAELFLIGGRQVATGDGLEVLALACLAELPAGEPTTVTIERVLAEGAVAVLPWGLGKWWGRRGRVVAQLIERWGSALALGDTRARWGQVTEPRLFSLAREHDLPILPGSDAFPLGGRERQVASYGLLLEAGMDRERPAASLKRALALRPAAFRSFGRRAALAPTCRDQILMQVRKRVAGRVA